MFIRTRRLMLRPIFSEDWREVYTGLNDEGVVRMLARAPWPYAEQDARAFCAQKRSPSEMKYAITVPLRRGAPLVGMIGIDRDAATHEHELGYWIARDWHGHGLATEAVRAVLETARALGVSEVVAGHFHDNPASERVLRKCGFVPTGDLVLTSSSGRANLPVQTVRYRNLLTEMTIRIAA